MPDVPTRVSVIIRCYNEEEHIGRLLVGLAAQTVRELDIVVVDSGSTDATLAIAERFGARILHIAPGEFSFGRALNRGLAAARGDLAVIASAHVYPVYDDWLEQLLAPFADPRVALVYGKQRGDHRTRFSEHRVFERWFPDEPDADQKHPFCNNANAAIRRTVWAGLPYNEVLTGLEDLDWAQRALTAGYRLAYSAAAEIIHVHEESPAAIRNRYRREAMALARIQPNLSMGFPGFLRLFVSNAASDLVHAWRRGLLGGHAGDILTFRLMQFWGTYRGFAHPQTINLELKRRFYYPHGWPGGAPGSDAAVTGTGARIDYARLTSGALPDE